MGFYWPMLIFRKKSLVNVLPALCGGAEASVPERRCCSTNSVTFHILKSQVLRGGSLRLVQANIYFTFILCAFLSHLHIIGS